jgi:ectoine hydroxylase-related dioxygenase (phytanoyl-CoA dioxygenase family)
MVNSIWMLNDFTAENGATGVVPMSHLSRSHPTPDLVEGHHCLVPVEGKRGSLMMWHAGLFHTARANRTRDVRVGMNISYYPPWFNIYSEGGHQPVWPEVFAKMPTQLQELLPQKKGHSRAEIYEGG